MDPAELNATAEEVLFERIDGIIAAADSGYCLSSISCDVLARFITYGLLFRIRERAHARTECRSRWR